MKKLRYILMPLFSILLASCNLKSPNTQVDKSNSNTIIGNWTMTNAPQGTTVKITFHDNGTFMLINRQVPQQGRDHINDIEGNWSKNGNKIYLSTPNKTDVGVMEVLSHDQNNLVFHMQGEPDNEINYLRKD